MSGGAIVGQVTGVNSAGHVSYDATNRTENTRAESGETQASNGIGFTPVIGEDIRGPTPRITRWATSTTCSMTTTSSMSPRLPPATLWAVRSLGSRHRQPASSPRSPRTPRSIATSRREPHDAFNDALVQTGDGVGGQALGIVSAGRTSLDATNLTDDAELLTGDALGTDSAIAVTGDSVRRTGARRGHGIGGNDDLVFANTSRDVESETGDAETFNNDFGILGPIDIGGIIQDVLVSVRRRCSPSLRRSASVPSPSLRPRAARASRTPDTRRRRPSRRASIAAVAAGEGRPARRSSAARPR